MSHMITIRDLLIALGGCCILAGCSTPTVTKVQTVVEKEPVAVQPITKAQIPPAPPAIGKRPPTLSQAADVALAGHCRDIAFILRVLPLLYVSAGVPVPELPVYPECQKH